MCARESGVLSYPLRLPDELQPPTIHLLTEALSHMQRVVNDLWERLDEVGQIRGRHVWKQLEDWLPRPEGLPSRVWRCALEGAGRTLRSQAHRKQLFDLLLPLFSGEELLPETARLVGLAYQVRDQIEGERNKVGYLLNLLEQVARFHAQNERLPQDYFELQSPPVLKTAQLPLAADDGPDKGQVYRMELGGGQVALRLKVPGEEGWHWTETVTFSLPEVVEPTQTRAPTLRLKEVKGGETIAVLDFVVEDQARQKNPGGDHVLAFDWGVRRLLSLTILSREGEQLTPPFFVDIGGLAGKQARLRQQIDQLKVKKARLRRRERKASTQAIHSHPIFKLLGQKCNVLAHLSR